jgi:2-keto-4-pentenoate hydratase/2-oxohepta-3-ene-1,7-dioic acid hydratase in catechol pathway
LEIPKVPCLFIKTSNSIGQPNGPVTIPKTAQGEAGLVDYEVELALVFNKTFKDIKEEDAMSVVLG